GRGRDRHLRPAGVFVSHRPRCDRSREHPAAARAAAQEVGAGRAPRRDGRRRPADALRVHRRDDRRPRRVVYLRAVRIGRVQLDVLLPARADRGGARTRPLAAGGGASARQGVETGGGDPRLLATAGPRSRVTTDDPVDPARTDSMSGTLDPKIWGPPDRTVELVARNVSTRYVAI